MKIVVIGATGTIGRAVAAALTDRGHQVIGASRSGERAADLTRPDTVEALLNGAGELGAVVCCAASGNLTLVGENSDEVFLQGLRDKLLGQVLLLRRALPHLRDGGSVTITAGTFSGPLPGSSFGALVNAGLEAFVRSASAELPRGLRVNAVSPGWVRETLEAMGAPPGGIPAADLARAYVRTVEDPALTGAVLRP